MGDNRGIAAGAAGPAFGVGRGRMRGFDVCFLGFCLVIALSTSTSLFTGSSGGAPLPEVGWLSSLVRATAFVTLALLSRRIGPLWRRRSLVPLAAGTAAAGVALVVLAVWMQGDVRGGVYVAGLAVLGVGYTVLYLLWIELYAKMDLPHVLMYFSLVHLASAAVSFVLAAVGARWLVACCLIAMPGVSAALYARSLRRSADVSYMQGEETEAGWSFPLGPVVLLATFTLANNFVRHYLTADLKSAVLVGVMLAAVLVLALVRWRADRFDLGILYALCLPLIVAGSLCVLVPLPGFGTLGGLLSNAAYTLFSIFATVLLCNISYRYGVDAPWLFGFSNAAICCGSLGAGLLARLADGFGDESAVPTLAVSAVVLVFVCLYMAFARRDVLSGSWGLTRMGATGAQGDAETFDERCARMARLRGLTKREEEVMLLLVKDLPFAAIEEELSISNSTLKTHARHIYAKFAVGGRRELAELVGARGAVE